MTQKTVIKGLKDTDLNNQIRLLLFLWYLGSVNNKIKQTQLNNYLTRTDERSKDYQKIYDQLQEIQAIALEKVGRSMTVSLTEKGLETLTQGLNNQEFLFAGQQVGSRVANALLKWIREKNLNPNLSQQKEENQSKIIESYQEFEKIVLELYHRLNQDYNLHDLVPIYRVRRILGERISRPQFRDWLFDMQGKDLILLIGGEMTDISPDKIEDSVQTNLGKIRYYIQLL
jgi:NAD-dependent DNA ligase